MGKMKQAWEGLKTKKELKLMDGESRALYELTVRLMKSEHLTYEQVWECYDQDPEFSFVKKFQICFYWMCADFLHMKKHRDEFIADLTPEEMAIYDEQCEEGLWREAYKRMKQKIMSELRRKKRSGEVQVSEKELDDLFDTLKDDDKDA